MTALDSSTATDLHWATTAINPALSIVGLLPTPQLRTAVLRTEISLSSVAGTREHTTGLPRREPQPIIRDRWTRRSASPTTKPAWCHMSSPAVGDGNGRIRRLKHRIEGTPDQEEPSRPQPRTSDGSTSLRASSGILHIPSQVGTP